MDKTILKKKGENGSKLTSMYPEQCGHLIRIDK